MRLALCSLVLALTGMAVAQDTNFATGPQYLITNNASQQLLRSIATPTLSLNEAAPATSNAAPTEAPEPVTSPAPLANVYWGDDTSAEADAPREVTPSFSLSQATGETESEQTSETVEATTSTAEPSGVIEMSAGAPANVPASIFNPGVTGTADTQSLLNRGYGMSLGELAAYWKSHKRPAAHVITNEELERKPRT